MTTADVRRHLLGTDHDRTVRYLLVAVGVLLTGLGLLYWRWLVSHRGIAWRPLGVDLVWLVAAVAVGLAALPGYRNDGLVAGWALGAALALAVYLRPVVVPAMAFDEPHLRGFATALVFGVGLGTMGFGVGAGVRRTRGRVGGSNRTAEH